MKILLVEDDDARYAVIKDALKVLFRSCSITRRKNFVDGVSAFLENKENAWIAEPYSLVIVESKLPVSKLFRASVYPGRTIKTMQEIGPNFMKIEIDGYESEFEEVYNVEYTDDYLKFALKLKEILVKIYEEHEKQCLFCENWECNEKKKGHYFGEPCAYPEEFIPETGSRAYKYEKVLKKEIRPKKEKYGE